MPRSRVTPELLARAKLFAHRVVDVAEALEARGVSRRVVDQLVGAGTSVAANYHEADEAVSRADFCKCLGTVIKELNECRFWIEFVGERGWVPPARLSDLAEECRQLRLVTGSIVARTKARGLRDKKLHTA